MTVKNIAWGTYTRISEDPDDSQRGVTRQNEDTADEVVRRGGKIAKLYVENDTSAFKKRKVKVTDPTGREYIGYRVVRPVWHEALADLRSGAIKGLMVYNLDRLARDPRDLEDAIEVVEHYGARILSATQSDIDLSTETGILSARLLVLMANKASADTARRVRRAHLESARKGKAVGGRRPFGYNEDKVTIRESEAALIREAAADLLSGVRITSVRDQWNETGVTSVMGVPWSTASVRQLLLSPRLSGWRVHRIGGTPWTVVPPVALDRDGRPVRGEWEPILDDTTHKAVIAALTSNPDKRKHVPHRNARTYLTTGFLRCGECSGLLYGNRQGDNYYYRCDAKGCGNSGSGRGIDAWVRDLVVGYSDVIESQYVDSPNDDAARLRGLNEQLDSVTEMIDDIMTMYRERQLPARVAFKNVAELEESRDRVLGERDALEVQVGRGAPEIIDAAKWDAMDLDRQRAAAERLVETVYLRRAAKRGNRFDPARLDPVMREPVSA